MSEDEARANLEQAISDYLVIVSDEPRFASAWALIVAGIGVDGDTSYEVALSDAMAPHTGHGLARVLARMVERMDDDE
jgi:hypothetical protein